MEGKKGLVRLDDCLSGVWVVVDGRAGCQLAKSGMLEGVTDCDCCLFEPPFLGLLPRRPFGRSLASPLGGGLLVLKEEDLERRRLDRRRDVDDFLEPWDTERDILGSDSRQMEGVQRHLGRRLTHTLGTDASHHFARVDQGVLEPGLDLIHQPVEGLLREPLLLRASPDDLLGSQVVPEVDFHEPGGVSVGRHEERACVESWLLIDPDACLEKLVGPLDDVVRGQVCQLPRSDTKALPGCPQEPVHVDRQPNLIGWATEYLGPKLLSVLSHLRCLSLHQVAKPPEGSLVKPIDSAFEHAFLQGLPSLGSVTTPGREELEAARQGRVVHLQERDTEILNVLSLKTILAVDELNEVVARGPHGAVVLDLDVLESLDQTPLDVARVRRLDSRVDEALSSSHSVEVELLRGEAGDVAAGDEALAVGAEVVLAEMRERSPVEPERNSLSVDVLLPDTSHDLGDVDEPTLRARGNHLSQSIVWSEIRVRESTCRVECRSQLAVDANFESLPHS